MKIKVLSRNPTDYVRERKCDIHKLPRNLDPQLHPFESAREYTRALNATKLERIFAKPFLGALSGHVDGVFTLCKHPTSISTILSGSCDGEIRIWNLNQLECLHTIVAHSGFVRGLCVNPEGTLCISCGDDKIVKSWHIGSDNYSNEPVSTFVGRHVYQSIDHHQSDTVYATSGDQIDIWNEQFAEPIRSYTWGVDSIHCVKFNPVERNILISAASDRSVTLYDIRKSSPLRKVVLEMKTNSISWNPIEAYIFTVANEDTNLYTFDLRKLGHAVNVHKDHVMAVLDVDYAPTGQEFVSGSFDKSIRIFQHDAGHSREVYYTKRMQRIYCVKWSVDAKYILSGSNEANIRLWKANAAEKLAPVGSREKASLRYSNKLRRKFRYHPQVRRIARHRHVPKMIYKASQEKRIMLASRRRKLRNVIRHSKPGTVKQVAERTKHIVSVVK